MSRGTYDAHDMNSKEQDKPTQLQAKKKYQKNICQAAEWWSIIPDAKEPGESRQGDVVGKEKEQQGGGPGETKTKRQF